MLLPLFPVIYLFALTTALGIYDLPPVPSQLTVPASAATFAASVASAEATALAIQNTYGISTGAPNDLLPDPCGPPTQASAKANSLSTCHTNVCTKKPNTSQSYGVTCLPSDSAATSIISQTLDLNACANAMIEICYTMAGSYGPPATDEWVFTNGTTTGPQNSIGAKGGGNCTLGFWLPSGGAAAPSFLRCVDGIFSPLVETCGGGAKSVAGNGGSVNLAIMPGFGIASNGEGEGGVNEVGITGGSGVAVDSGYPSYFVVA